MYIGIEFSFLIKKSLFVLGVLTKINKFNTIVARKIKM